MARRRHSHINKGPSPHETPGQAEHLLVRSAPLILVCGIVGLVFTLTMPKFLCPGDNFCTRADAINIIENGRIGFPYSMKPVLGGFVQERGQYFFENDKKQMLYPKYGIAYTWMYLLPVWLEKLHSGHVDLFQNTPSLVLYVNVEHILIAVLSAAYMFGIVAFYTNRAWMRIAFVLSSIFGTFLWFHLRRPAHESFQMLPFVGFYFHSLCFVRALRLGREPSNREWVHLLSGTLWMGLLVLMKVAFVPVFGALWLFAFCSGPAGQGLIARASANVRRHKGHYLLFLALPTFLVAALLLLSQSYKFGSPFNTGYGQWMRDGRATIRNLNPTNIPKKFADLFVLFNRGNLFVHYPILLFALFGYHRFWRKNGFESWYMLLVALAAASVPLCGRSFGFGYGPRYFLASAIIMCLPVVDTWDVFTGRLKTFRGAVGLLGKAAMIAVLLWSVKMQWNMNALHYYTFYNVRGLFDQLPESLTGPLEERYPRPVIQWGVVHGHLIAYREGKGRIPGLEGVKKRLPPEHRDAFEQQIRPYLMQMAQPNFYFSFWD